MTKKLTLDDLPKEARQKFELAELTNLTQDQRARVLAHAQKVNAI